MVSALFRDALAETKILPSRSFWQSFTVEGALDGKDSISADLTAGFNPVDGIKVKKFKLTTCGKIVGEARCV